MPTIIKLQYKQTRAGGHVLAFLDTDETLTLDADLAVQRQLASGMMLTDSELQDLLQANQLIEAKRRLIRYLSLRRKTEAEAVRYLRQHQFAPEIIDPVIAAAREQGYLNDDAYAEAFAASHNRSGKGPGSIAQDLRRRGIDKARVEKATEPLRDYDVQLEQATALAEKKAAALLRSEPNPTKAWIKMYQFLLRRGFDPTVCREATQHALSETPPPDLDE